MIKSSRPPGHRVESELRPETPGRIEKVEPFKAVSMKYPFVVQGPKLGGLDLLGGLGLAFRGASVEFGEWSLWAAANLATKDNLPIELYMRVLKPCIHQKNL